jgi:transcriptional regulator with XRE-family HTH domain
VKNKELESIGRLAKKTRKTAPGGWADALLHLWNNQRKLLISRRDKRVTSSLQQLGRLLKSERERAGVTVRQLADAAGMVASTVSRLETGFIASPKPDHLQRLAQALGIDVEELYAAAGYLEPGSLPKLRPYLRTKYGLTDQQASQIEGYMQAVRDTNQAPGKERRHDRGDEAA